MRERIVEIVESGRGPYGQLIMARHHLLGADEPGEQGGKDAGPDPFELLLAALGACTAMTIRAYALRKQMPLQEVEVELHYVPHAGAGPLARAQFERAITLGGDLTDEQRHRLLEIAGRSPVAQILQRGADITTMLVEVGPVEAETG
jgi:putative redox protein